MRHVTAIATAMFVVAGLAAGTAEAATSADQLVGLARAGLGDDVLIALIQTDGSTFQLSAADILALHKAGLSDAVILAMEQTASKTPAAAVPPVSVSAPSPAESPAGGSAVDRALVSQPPAPAVVNVTQTVTQRVITSPAPPTQVVYTIPALVPVQKKPVPPVYWGWGGRRRPDTWAPSTETPVP